MSEGDSAFLLDRHLNGEEDASRELFLKYAERLRLLVTRRLSSGIRRRFDADDVVQSTFRSFFIRSREGRYCVEEKGDLWRLLAAIAINKLRGKVDFHSAQVRDTRAEAHLDANESLHAEHLLVSSEPRPEEVVAATEILARSIRSLDVFTLQVFTKSLQGSSNGEIGDSLDCSQRTVRRCMQNIRQRITSALSDEPTPASGLGSLGKAIASEEGTYLCDSDFVLQRLVGTGGTGKVYRALWKTNGKTVAVKSLLKRHQQDPIALDRFLQERRLLHRLQHPHIVGLHGIGRFPHGGLFLVLEYIDGMNLALRLANGSLPPRDAAHLVMLIAGAVQHAHDRGILHLDLKPENVLVANGGQVAVTDFGFGELMRQGADRSFRTVGGTAAYMAPEQITPSVGAVGPRTDVFGLGGILYAALTARPPRNANSVGRHPVVRSRRRKNNGVDRELMDIFKKCLAPLPKNRFVSPRELAGALQSWIGLHD